MAVDTWRFVPCSFHHAGDHQAKQLPQWSLNKPFNPIWDELVPSKPNLERFRCVQPSQRPQPSAPANCDRETSPGFFATWNHMVNRRVDQRIGDMFMTHDMERFFTGFQAPSRAPHLHVHHSSGENLHPSEKYLEHLHIPNPWLDWDTLKKHTAGMANDCQIELELPNSQVSLLRIQQYCNPTGRKSLLILGASRKNISLYPEVLFPISNHAVRTIRFLCGAVGRFSQLGAPYTATSCFKARSSCCRCSNLRPKWCGQWRFVKRIGW